LPLSLCRQTPSKHVSQWAERRKGRRKQCVDVWWNFVHSSMIPLHRFVMLQDPWRLVFLYVLRPNQSNCAFLPSWLMRSSFVYHSKLCSAPHVTEPHKKNYLYYVEGNMGSIWPQAEINGKTQKLANVCDIVRKALRKIRTRWCQYSWQFKKRESKRAGVT
jgi:hypothetical protein